MFRLGLVGSSISSHWLNAIAQEQFRVSALYHPCPARGRRLAKLVGVRAMGSVLDLLASDDVDAILLGHTWFDLWPLHEAARLEKPVLCVGSSRIEPNALAELRDSAKLYLMSSPRLMEMVRIQKHQQGPAQRIEAVVVAPRPASRWRIACLVQCCAEWIGEEPLSVTSDERQTAITFSQDRSARIAWCLGSVPECRFFALTEDGSAEIALPNRIGWRTSEGASQMQLRLESSERLALRFLRRAQWNLQIVRRCLARIQA
jgi:hypothetical protein